MTWETVIGLEVHVQLATQSKIFSGASTQFGAAPNSQACAIDLGLPGVLPVLNQNAVKFAVMFGLAINADIERESIFARKNYFYPDLPKGYQISQLDKPIVGKGHVDIVLANGDTKTIRITRAHLEEDAGKSHHEDFHDSTGIDLNRAGMPLLEIVSEPDIRNAEEAISYLKMIHSIITYLEISDGNMSEGSMRCDINISIRRQGDLTLGTRTEIKNVNSFRFVEKAIHTEVERQIDMLENGQAITQETRLFDSQKVETRPMRSKEEANDYRYFPDPDLLPVILSKRDIEKIAERLPELPTEKRLRFEHEYQLNQYDATVLTNEKAIANYFETVLNEMPGPNDLTSIAKLICNWITSELMGSLNKDNLSITRSPIPPAELAKLMTRIIDGTLSSKLAKEVFAALWAQSGSTDEIINRHNLRQVTDTEVIEPLIDQVLGSHADQVEQFRQADESKKKKLIGFFVGKIMKESKGKANPQQVNSILQKKLH